MRDLIRRKKICDYIKGEINPYGKPFEGTAYELGLKIMRYIDAMDSDYDIDKVVEEFEKIRAKDTCYKEKCDTKEFCRICVVDDAIEIVKQGCVDDDVCEWKDNYSNNQYSYLTSCDKIFEFDSDYNFCPYCGKKIKVVE